MLEKFKTIAHERGRLIVGIGILICIAGLVIGYIKPKLKLQTVSVNMATDTQTSILLESGVTVNYTCSTKGYAMNGIQIGVTKNGKDMTGQGILCSVYDENHETLLSQMLISMSDVDEGQFVYIPFDNSEQCNGTISIDFVSADASLEAPGLLANKVTLDDASTTVGGEVYEGNLMSSYIYALKYYPFMYDLLVALCILIGVFFLGERKVTVHEQA